MACGAGQAWTRPGKYGDHGNLELVVCDPEDGLRVGWLNNDAVEASGSAAVGCWSGALWFGRGRCYDWAAVAHVDAGPNWIEVLALAAYGDLCRHVWSPADGFVDHGPVARAVVDASRMVSTADGALVAVTLSRDGISIRRSVPGPEYPLLRFTGTAAPGDHPDSRPVRPRPGLGREPRSGPPDGEPLEGPGCTAIQVRDFESL